MMAKSSASEHWAKQIGLELYSVRDLLEKDFEGTHAKVAALGYKEVERSVTVPGLQAVSGRCWTARPDCAQHPCRCNRRPGSGEAARRFSAYWHPVHRGSCARQGSRQETVESVKQLAAQYNKYARW